MKVVMSPDGLKKLGATEIRIYEFVRANPGKSEIEIAVGVFGVGTPQQRVNPTMRLLSSRQLVIRDKTNGAFRYRAADENWTPPPATARSPNSQDIEGLTEDQIKGVLRTWLEASGYQTRIAMGKERGIDIDARREKERWIIEVKGPGSLQPMRVNYFISMLGELLQRMDDPEAKYSIALPDLAQYRGLWQRLPTLAKERTTISAIFVSTKGEVSIA